MKRVFVTDKLPVSDLHSEECNSYYLIWTPFGKMLAMYLEDEDGQEGWWTSYASKLACEVYCWLDERE